MSMMAMNERAELADDPAPFRSVDGALRFAYLTEGRSVVKISSLLGQMRGSTVRGKSRSDGPWDDHAQAAMILALTDRTLRPRLLVCVRGMYTQPNDPMLELRKQTDYRLLAEIVRESRPEIPHWYAVDVIREWARDRRHHTDAWWSEHLGIHPRKLSYFNLGRRDRDQPGITPLMNDLLAVATSDLHVPMLEAGLLEF